MAIKYHSATHADLMKLTRRLIRMSIGDLVALHKLNAQNTSGPFIRGVLFARMAIDSEPKNGKARSNTR